MVTHLETLEKYWKCNKMVHKTGKTIQQVWEEINNENNEKTERKK